MPKLKQDKYRKVRGGKAEMLNVFCSTCGNKLLYYQKDGDGNLLRCYLNRIFAPPHFEKLQHNSKIRQPNDMPNLVCESCNTVIGIPMKHHDGRLAFRLRHGLFYKKKADSEEQDKEKISFNLNLDQVAERQGISVEQVIHTINVIKRSMIPFSKTIDAIENGILRTFVLTRHGVGSITTRWGNFYLFDFHINDIWERYSVLIMANFDENFMPLFNQPQKIFLRIDSGCETGQVFGDKTCECREQLELAMSQVQSAGEGIIIHIPHHEGRGMGLPFKLATLILQRELGLDTVESANVLAPDGVIEIRTFSGVICIIKFLGILISSEINLATNNPIKAKVFTENLYKISDFIPIVIPATADTEKHLLAKQKYLGHINLVQQEKKGSKE